MSFVRSQLKKRVLSVLVAVPIITTAIYWSAWSYFLFFLFIVTLTMLEFYQLMSGGNIYPNLYWGIGGGIMAYTLTFTHASGHIPVKCLYILGPVISGVYLVELYRKSATPFSNIACTLLGIAYVGAPFACLHMIAFAQGTYNPNMVMGILLILWANDVGAYVMGTSIGKRRLFRRISPKKSWEGAVGGAVLALILSHTLGRYCSEMSIETWLGMGIIITVTGTYGDLVESMLKRSLNVKDSGGTIPGHGGFLDRFDSFLLAIPFVVAYIKLVC